MQENEAFIMLPICFDFWKHTHDIRNEGESDWPVWGGSGRPMKPKALSPLEGKPASSPVRRQAFPETLHRQILTSSNLEVRVPHWRSFQVIAWAIQLHATYPQCPNCWGLGVVIRYFLAWPPLAHSPALHWAPSMIPGNKRTAKSCKCRVPP